MNFETIAIYSTLFLALLTTICSIRNYRHKTVKKAYLNTKLKLDEPVPVIQATVENTGGIAFSVDQVRINLTNWTSKSIYKPSTAVGRQLSIVNYFFNPHLITDYPSDEAIISNTHSFSNGLGIGDEMKIHFDPEKMIDAQHQARNGFENKIVFWIFCKISKVEVVLHDKVVAIPLDSDSRDYLWRRYKDDDRIYCRVFPESWESTTK